MAFNISLSRSGEYSTREKRKGFLLAVPAVIWLVLFFLLPLLIVVVISFLTRGRSEFIEPTLTLANYEAALRPNGPYFRVFIKSIGIALVTTVICLLAGYPLAFFISTRRSKAVQSFVLFLVILPFWTNFLVRTYAWSLILSDQGILNSLFLGLGLITADNPLRLINTDFAVYLGLIYTYLPFMVLPIYASVERFDFRLVEAANDLGANDLKAFLRVVLPMTMPGIFAGCILVFIPCVGAFITPDILGGTRGIMIGNLVGSNFRGSGNWPLGSALSVMMMGTVVIALVLYSRLARR
ncbi:MAG: ABC transporter permease [Anaerolinea sp.]|nr:ABC transporter permease [Anaerolinea sp.]